MEKTSKFQAVSKQGNFVWYGTNYLLDGSFISAVPGTPQKDYMALDVYNCEHVGFLPTQHIVMTHDPWCPGTAYEEDYGEVAFANFYTEENVISCEHDSLFVIGLSDVVCTDFSEMIKISYNPTATPIPLLYQDLFEDWDISAGGLNDWGDMDTLHNIMYQYDPANPSLVFGMFKAPFYNDRMYNMTFVNGPQYVWPTQGFCSGWGLDSLWYLMTRPGYFYPSGSHTDFSMLMCSQPISLNPGDKHMEVWINFGKNLNDGMTWSQWYHKILRYVGFYRGDVNASDTLEVPAMDISDLVYLFNYLYQAGPAPQPFIDQGNVDGKGPYGGPVDTVCPKNNVDIQDLVYLVNYVFKSGPAPVDYVRFIPSFWSRPSLFLNPNW